jgi:hypothetical protein
VPGRIADDGNVVVLVDADTCWLVDVRLNLAKDGEHELRYDRFNISAGGRGSCRGKQRSRRGARGDDVGEMGTQAAGTIGKIKRWADLNVGLCDDDDNNVGVRGDEDDTSLHRALLLADVHEDKLEPAGSRRRRAPIIIILFSIQ